MMRAKPMKSLGLGLGALAAVGMMWLLMAPDRTVAVAPGGALQPCSGEMGRFQMVTHPPKDAYLLDTCTGTVWKLLRSPDKLEPGAWVVMDRYDTRDQVTRLIEYLRGQVPDRDTEQPAETGQPAYQEQEPVQPSATPDQQYETDSSQGQAAEEQYQTTDEQYPDTDQPPQQDEEEYPPRDQQDQGDEWR